MRHRSPSFIPGTNRPLDRSKDEEEGRFMGTVGSSSRGILVSSLISPFMRRRTGVLIRKESIPAGDGFKVLAYAVPVWGAVERTRVLIRT